MKIEEIKITIQEYDSIEELDKEDQSLVYRAKEAVKKAYAPYSGFRVGAALLLANNEIIESNNQENAAYPSGLCAERIAIFYANSKYPDIPVKAIAITAHTKSGAIKEPVPPCGACRQVLLESEIRFDSPIKLILAGDKKIQIIESVKSLLPLNFDSNYLLIKD